ncbi:hypothetical protein AGMMS50239_31220 [Bacteroidia bacterium]|nr:hypothetical protein AGMMS50239_31220 [Bacteroidia bacterium]
MEKTGLLNSIVRSVYNIDLGRKGLVIEGGESEGRVFLSRGLSSALAVFKDVHDNAGNDIETVILADYTFVTEEHHYCNSTEPMVAASMDAALASFDDALRALKTVQDATAYKSAETTWPHLPKYRYHNMPKDAFHLACNAHRTRISNTLRTPGINLIEREVYEQRSKNMSAAQIAYFDKQQNALTQP